MGYPPEGRATCVRVALYAQRCSKAEHEKGRSPRLDGASQSPLDERVAPNG
jgi:hypothetical protein